MTISEISQLTDYQIHNIYFRADPRDKNANNNSQQPSGDPISPFKFFWLVNAGRGKSDQEIIDRWKEANPKLSSQAIVGPGWREEETARQRRQQDNG